MWSYFKISVWAIVWLVLWILFAPIRKKRDNCLTWAMKKCDNDGGYLVIRWNRTSKFKLLRWPHFLWLNPKQHQNLESWQPLEDTHSEKIFPLPWFDGHIKKGDNDDGSPEN